MIVVSEFGPGTPSCDGGSNGCMVATAAAMLIGFGKPIPRIAGGRPDLINLGASMGARHRANDPTSRHGICPHGWCSYCAYLELRARGVPCAFGKLTLAEIRAYAKAGHAMAVPGWYGWVPFIKTGSYNAHAFATGRSDTFQGWHGVAIWGDNGGAIISDPDFGSSSRPIIPPYSVWTWTVVDHFYGETGGWGICYTTAPVPRPVTPPTLPKEAYMDPHVIPDKVCDILPGGTLYKMVNGQLVNVATPWGGPKSDVPFLHNVGTYGVEDKPYPPRAGAAHPLRALRLDAKSGPAEEIYVGLVGDDMVVNVRDRA